MTRLYFEGRASIEVYHRTLGTSSVCTTNLTFIRIRHIDFFSIVLLHS